MAHDYFDTSALVKAYVSEAGSKWVRSLVDPGAGNDVFILRVTEVEMTSAIIRQRNARALPASDAASLLADFRSDAAAELFVIDVSQGLFTHTCALVEHYGLRTYDVLQLAAALELHSYRTGLGMASLTLVSADHELNSAAQAGGLAVDDPNMHP